MAHSEDLGSIQFSQADSVQAGRSAGSIADVSARLLLWAKREGKGLAQVEYSSEFSRQRVLAQVQGELAIAGIEVRAIALLTQQPTVAVIQDLLAQLGQVPAGHVVSVTGFGVAFADADALRILSFNREALLAFPVRQVWWMTLVVAQTALYAMPDFHGWLSPKLRLTESIAAAPEGMQITEHINRRVSVDDAIARSNQLIQQFEQAKQAGGGDFELLTTYLLPALEALAEVGAEQKLRDLTSRFEGLLGQINVLDRREIATSLSRLGTLYWKQGRYVEASPLLKKALAIHEQQLGPHHPDTGQSLNNLALLYKSIGRYAEAEPLYKRALAISEQQLGPDHPNTAASLNNLASLHEAIGDYVEAEFLYKRALTICEQQLGPDHLNTATSLNNLAGLYHLIGRDEEAESLYKRALAICEQRECSEFCVRGLESK